MLKDKSISFYYNRNRIEIQNYNRILALSKTKITFPTLCIIGKELSIESMDGYLIVIKGIIKNLKLGEFYGTVQDTNEGK